MQTSERPVQAGWGVRSIRPDRRHTVQHRQVCANRQRSVEAGDRTGSGNQARNGSAARDV